ncbi:immunoglobulin lambda-1 light chain-like [Octodon degus]|uniref:immunoglobulin lambda-1 light chain-like n=1 Tax=Octodon degus TaxID=10160 RepID=UPI000C9FD250|nr:immunoglobulin lambda-1 light chain-like [Octodon degus]
MTSTMSWCPLLFSLLAHCTGSWAQAVLTQPPSVSGFPGETVTISCTGSSNNVGGYAVQWFQQLSGTAPKLIIYSNSNRPSGVSGRFSGSKSGNSASLTISGLQSEDEADYYCEAYDSSLSGCTVLQPYGEAHTKASSSSARREPSLSAAPGASARLTCTLSSGISVGGYHIYWYQQKLGSPPRFLLYYKSDSDKYQGSGIPSRFSGSKDTSANAGVLHISALQPEDEADYYCAIWHNSASHSDTHAWRSGTKTQPALGVTL